MGAITRDAGNNFVANVAATAWAVGNITGGVVAGDLVPAADSKSAVFTGHANGTCNILAISGALANISSGTITVAGSAGVDEHQPLTFALQQNFPNPFIGLTTIRFELPQPAPVRLRVFDVLGREVATLVDEVRAPGVYTMRWDARALRSGTYFCRLESNGRRQVRKMLVTK